MKSRQHEEATMKQAWASVATVAMIFALLPSAAGSSEPPPDAAAAEARGLQRLTPERLRVEFAGVREERTSRGETYLAHYGADGRIELKSGSSIIDRGTFSVTGHRGGSICLMLDKQMNQRLCTVWFAAPEGMQLYGYHPNDGQLRTISRPLRP
jgi:hypothetical protein